MHQRERDPNEERVRRRPARKIAVTGTPAQRHFKQLVIRILLTNIQNPPVA